jgi:hypothetical protein
VRLPLNVRRGLDPAGRRFFAVLHQGPIKSSTDAARAANVADAIAGILVVIFQIIWVGHQPVELSADIGLTHCGLSTQYPASS